MLQSVADNKSRMKAQDGFAAANSMLEKHGHRMNETMFNHWFEIVTKWATEMASFDNPSAPSGPSGPSDQSAHQDYDSPVIPRDRMNTPPLCPVCMRHRLLSLLNKGRKSRTTRVKVTPFHRDVHLSTPSPTILPPS